MIQTSQESYENFQLGKLLEHHEIPESCSGAIVFASLYDEDALDWARWFFDAEDLKRLKASGFKVHIMEFLNLLIRGRSRQGLARSQGGVVCVRTPDTGIEWIPDAEVEQLMDLDTLEQALAKLDRSSVQTE